MTGRYTHVRDDKESLELDADRTGRDGLLGPDATWARRREWRWKPSCNASALISAACAVFLSNLATAAWVATSLRRGRPGTFTETSVFCKLFRAAGGQGRYVTHEELQAAG